ncbi:MAG: ABC transporter ATP-binding protein [Arenicella sp.]
MSSEQQVTPVISVERVSKCYQSYDKPIHRLWHALLPKKQLGTPFWALNDVSLQVAAGETVGLVGKNGSGKSTLLQIVTGILQATQGSCQTHGRVSALLELGAGFNPEFTGLENARLNATIMGLSRDEFEQKLPDIIEFSGLGDFLHRPVKTYSSGMYVRLAFAVAINMQPDVLIIDEALAVGDIRFQAKCFRRIEQLKQQGVAILFVTHSTDSVLKYCDRAVLLNEGQLLKTGSPKDVVQQYMEMMFSSENASAAQKTEAMTAQISKQAGDGSRDSGSAGSLLLDGSVDHCLQQASYNDNEERWGDARAHIINYELRVEGQLVQHCHRGQRLQVSAQVIFHEKLEDLIYGITVKTPDGNPVYGSNTRLLNVSVPAQQAGDLITITFDLDLHLLANDYFISLGVAQEHAEKDNVAVDRRYDMIHLRVEDAPVAIPADAFGVAALNAAIDINRVGA